jgi:beta-lactamase regulating signal transducer with metallopeptidase domain
MIGILDFLETHGGMLLSGATIVLGLGAIVGGLNRAPAKRQRICEFTILFAGIWLVLACVPMNRISVRTAGANRQETTNTPSGSPAGQGMESRVEIAPAHPLLEAAAATTGIEARAPVAPETHAQTVETSWKRRFVWVFLIGSGLMGVRMALGQLALMWIHFRSKPAEELAEITAGEGAAGLDVRTSGRISRPISFGLIRAKVIIPLSYGERSERTRQVLRHEVAHIRRKDAWGNLLLNLGWLMFWFHPAFWWLSAQAALARELLADDWAASRGDKQAYAMELISLARMRVGSGATGALALGILGSKSQFYRRMQMLISRETSLDMGCSRFWRLTMTAMGIGIVAGLTATVGLRPAVAAAQAPAEHALLNSSDRPASTYVVKPGDTLRSIAISIYGDGVYANLIIAANPGMDLNRLNPGDSLKIPDKSANSAANVEEMAPRPATRSADNSQLIDSYRKLGAGVLEQEMKLLAEGHLAMARAVDEARMDFERTVKRIQEGLDDSRIMDLISNDSQIRQLADQLRKMEQDLKMTLTNMGPLSPKVKDMESAMITVQAQLEELTSKQIAAQRDRLIRTLQERVESTKQSLEALEKRMQAIQQASERLRSQQPPKAIEPKVETIGGRDIQGPANAPALPLDLVNLANSAMEAKGNLTLAEAKLSQIGEGSPEWKIAAVNLENSRKRVELLRRLIQISLNSAENEMAQVKAQYKAGLMTADRYNELQTRIEMIRMILGSMD